MKYKLKTLLVATILFSSYVRAEETISTQSNTTVQQDILKLFRTTGLDKAWERMAAHSLESLKQSHADISDAVWNKVFPEIDTNEYMEFLIPVYERHFTHDEILALIDFYESPAGKKWLRVQQGELLGESAEALKSWREEKFYEITKGLHEHTQNETTPSQSIEAVVTTPVD